MKSDYTRGAARAGGLSQQVQAAETPPDWSLCRGAPDQAGKL